LSGANFVVGEGGSWTPFAAEQTASCYDVAFLNTSTGQYSVWSTDSNGNYTGNIIGVVSGADPSFQSIETVFKQDLNHDGTIGLPGTPITIESYGSTSLVQSGNLYYLNPVAGGTGPTLKLNASNLIVGQAAPWVPIGAEQTSTGYDVAFKNTSTGQYAVWTTDSTGNYTGLAVGVVSGTDPKLESIENVFHQDLNNDGTIGVPSNAAALGVPSSAAALGASTLFAQGSGGFHFDFGQFADTIGQLTNPATIIDSLKTAVGQIESTLASEIHAIVEAAGVDTAKLDGHIGAGTTGAELTDHFGHFLVH
jgi:hypothetical protein